MKMTKQYFYFILSILIIINSSSCLAFGSNDISKLETPAGLATFPVQIKQLSPTVAMAKSTQLPLVITATPSIEKSTTPTELPQIAQSPSPHPVVLPTSSENGQILKIYLVAVGDYSVSGPVIGCGDSLVAVDVIVKPTVAVLRAALNELLSIKTGTYGQTGLYSALHQSNLQIDNLYIQNGLASIYLTGDLLLGGTCENPRVEEQLKATALQFSTVQNVEIFINGVPLNDVLSLSRTC